VCLCEAFKNLNANIRGIFIITEKLGLFLQNVFGWGVTSKQVKGGFANIFFLPYPL
jgi:hypothetical protein